VIPDSNLMNNISKLNDADASCAVITIVERPPQNQNTPTGCLLADTPPLRGGQKKTSFLFFFSCFPFLLWYCQPRNGQR
jgi:hypothetical protein